MDITPVHYQNRQDKPADRSEIETFEDVSRAIIDEFEKRWVVGVGDDGSVSCQECDTDGCEHERMICESLGRMTEAKEEAEAGVDAVEDTEAVPATADD